MDLESFLLAQNAIHDRNSWLRWLNSLPERPSMASEAWKATRVLAQAIADGRLLSDGERTVVNKVLAPLLKRAWTNLEPWFNTRTFPGGKGESNPDGAFVMLKKEVGGDPDFQAYNIFNFYQFLYALGPGVQAALRTCEVCKNFFVDHSRGGRGRFCSSACRGKSFRKR